MTLKDRISNDLERLVRPIDHGELQLGEIESSDLQVRITIVRDAKFTIREGRGRGALPGSVIPLDSWGDAQKSAADRQHEIEAAAGGRIDTWVGHTANNYLAPLNPTDCMEEQQAFGATESCAECNGDGQVTCPDCRGKKKLPCPACHALGQVDCDVCGGTTKVKCGSCSGLGYHEKGAAEVTVYERQRTPNASGPYVRVPCASCGGSGEKRCTHCLNGRMQCHDCNGAGYLTCKGCAGKGHVDCKSCNATGKTHRTATIECTTERAVRIDVMGGSPEDVQTLRERVPLSIIGKLAATSGGVSLTAWERNGLSLTTVYAATIPCESITATAGSGQFEIRGYGPEQLVYDYHGLIDHVLRDDFADLEKEVRKISFLRSLSRETLRRALHRFLDSEIHVQLLEAAQPSKKAGASRPAAAAVEAGSPVGHELLTEDYRTRATSLILKALAKLHRSYLQPSLLIATAAATLVMYGARHGMLPGTGPSRVLTVFAVMAVTWFLIELWTRRNLKKGINAGLWKRMRPSFRKQRRRYRLLCLAGFVIAWYGSMLAFNAEMHFRESWAMNYLPIDTGAFWR